MLRVCVALALLWSADALAETRIATWNIGGFHPIPESKLERIIEGLKQLDADVVVFPELNPLGHADTIAARLSEPAGACYRAAVPDQPLSNQEIGFIFKCGVAASDPALVVGSDLGKQGYRNAAVVSVKIGQFDFVLVGLHLKASRGAANRALREEQLKIVSAFIQGVLRGGERDVLVVGDYNMIPDEDDRNFHTLIAGGAVRVVSSEALTGGFTHISSGHPGNLLDGFAFTNVDEAEYREGSIEIVQMHDILGLTLAEFAQQVTDHLPVVAVFATDADHD